MSTLLFSRFFCLGVVMAACSFATAQSFNIDIESYLGDPPSGYGVPSSDFGAAANQPGFWNAYHGFGHEIPTPLLGLLGENTSVSVRRLGVGGGTGGGSHFPVVTGNYALLLNDYITVVDTTFLFSGLRNGRYKVFTYGIPPGPLFRQTHISITGSLVQNPQVSGNGLLLGNVFNEGVTHSVHEIIVTGGSFELTARSPSFPDPPYSYVNGFQIVAVPEPVTFLGLLVPFTIYLRKRR